MRRTWRSGALRYPGTEAQPADGMRRIVPAVPRFSARLIAQRARQFELNAASAAPAVADVRWMSETGKRAGSKRAAKPAAVDSALAIRSRSVGVEAAEIDRMSGSSRCPRSPWIATTTIRQLSTRVRRQRGSSNLCDVTCEIAVSIGPLSVLSKLVEVEDRAPAIAAAITSRHGLDLAAMRGNDRDIRAVACRDSIA